MCTGTHDFIPAANTCKVALYFDTAGGKAMNILHFRRDAGWTESDLRTFHGLISAAWDTNMSPLQSNTIVLSRIVVTDIGAEDSFEYDAVPPDDLTGGDTSPVMPNNVTVATKFTTGHAGRSFRGRVYFVGLTEINCVGDELTSGAQSGINDGWTDFFGELNDGDLEAELVIVSYCHDGAWRSTATVTPVTGISTEITLDSMRTRLAGRGM
jgi:hypothetical protein